MHLIGIFIILSASALFVPVPADDDEDNAISAIRNLRAHYDAGTDTIIVDWEWREIEGKPLEGLF
jgi:hypothetical protein